MADNGNAHRRREVYRVTLTKVTVATGSGYNNLQSIAQSITQQAQNDSPGTQYEMTVSINAPQILIKAQIWTTNQYLSSRGIKPWPGNSQVVSQDVSNSQTVLFRWTV